MSKRHPQPHRAPAPPPSPLTRAQDAWGRTLDRFAKELKRDPLMRRELEREGGVLFLVLMMVSLSKAISDIIAPTSTVLRQPGGVESVINFCTEQLAEHLRRDLTAYLEEEAKQPRH